MGRYITNFFLLSLVLLLSRSQSLHIKRFRKRTDTPPFPLHDEWRVTIDPSVFARLHTISMGSCTFHTPARDVSIVPLYPCTLSLSGMVWNVTLHSLNGTLNVSCGGVSVTTISAGGRQGFELSRNVTHLRVSTAAADGDERTFPLQRRNVTDCKLSGEVLAQLTPLMKWDAYFCSSQSARAEWGVDTLTTRHWVLQGTQQPYFRFTLWDLAVCHPHRIWDWSSLSSHLTFHLSSGVFKLYYALHAPWTDSFQRNSSLIQQPNWRV